MTRRRYTGNGNWEPCDDPRDDCQEEAEYLEYFKELLANHAGDEYDILPVPHEQYVTAPIQPIALHSKADEDGPSDFERALANQLDDDPLPVSHEGGYDIIPHPVEPITLRGVVDEDPLLPPPTLE